jgi:hypothetical protein
VVPPEMTTAETGTAIIKLSSEVVLRTAALVVKPDDRTMEIGDICVVDQSILP